jgi:hypothetical protein
MWALDALFLESLFFPFVSTQKKNPGDPFRKKREDLREALREALCTGKKKKPKEKLEKKKLYGNL